MGEIKAGPQPANASSALNQGETFSIMTGAPVPRGADAVVMVEYTSLQNDRVTITKGIVAGENIVAQGAEARSGSLVLNPGTRLNEAAIALAASVGKSRLQVFDRPHVAVLTTGDEIVDVDDAKIGPTQIRNSNSYSLAAQIQEAGGEPVSAADRPRRTTAAARINRARLASRFASDDRRCVHGPLRSGRASPGPNASRVSFHWSKNSTRSSCRIRSRPLWRERYGPRRIFISAFV